MPPPAMPRQRRYSPRPRPKAPRPLSCPPQSRPNWWQWKAKSAPNILESLGLSETGLARVIRAGYELLGLQTFFTVGPKEARAWTVHKGAKAPQAAGEIHTDFEKGFIRAETIAFDDYIALGGEAGAREAGKLRQEGKEYLVQDGDVMLFKFNV